MTNYFDFNTDLMVGSELDSPCFSKDKINDEGEQYLQVIVRDEAPSEDRMIDELARFAFRASDFVCKGGDRVVGALRQGEALAVSLVAEVSRVVVGHIAFSEVAIGDGSEGWYALGPVSVWPELQGRGIGCALVEKGIERLRLLGAAGCVVVGDADYYRRFGFVAAEGFDLERVQLERLLRLDIKDGRAAGAVKYHAAFDVVG